MFKVVWKSFKYNRKNFLSFFMSEILSVAVIFMLIYIQEALSQVPGIKTEALQFAYQSELRKQLRIIIPCIILIMILVTGYSVKAYINTRIWDYKLFQLLGIRKKNLKVMIGLEYVISGMLACGFGILFGLIGTKIIKEILHTRINARFVKGISMSRVYLVLILSCLIMTIGVYITLQILLDTRTNLGDKICLMNKQYARMHACEIGDMIQIRDKRLKVIGLIDNSVYSGMIIPYQTMLNVYKEEKDIQFSGTFFCENELQKQKRIDEVIEQIKEKDNHADILGVTEGEELYKNALYTKIQWRIVRGMCALVAILFFMINETIVLMAKAKKERKIMGINLALGATERDIKYCLFFETLLVTLLAVFLVMITLRPLAKLASLEHIIILDSMVIVETVILAVWACEILTWIIVSRIKKENIADMVRTTRDI